MPLTGFYAGPQPEQMNETSDIVFEFDGKDRISAFLMTVATDAGAIATRVRDTAKDGFVATKSKLDFVTEADLAVEKFIISKLQEMFPEDVVLGEESGIPEDALASGDSKGAVWIIDPIDGTFNFLRGLPEWGICIARMQNGLLTHGVIAFPDLDILAIALRGRGSWANGRRLQSIRPDLEAERLVVLGYNHEYLAPARYGDIIADLIANDCEYRRYGAACFGLYAVATGWADAYFEASLNVWDACAGLLLLAEAGGHSCHLPLEVFLHKKGPVYATADTCLAPELQQIFTPFLDETGTPVS